MTRCDLIMTTKIIYNLYTHHNTSIVHRPSPTRIRMTPSFFFFTNNKYYFQRFEQENVFCSVNCKRKLKSIINGTFFVYGCASLSFNVRHCGYGYDWKLNRVVTMETYTFTHARTVAHFMENYTFKRVAKSYLEVTIDLGGYGTNKLIKIGFYCFVSHRVTLTISKKLKGANYLNRTQFEIHTRGKNKRKESKWLQHHTRFSRSHSFNAIDDNATLKSRRLKLLAYSCANAIWKQPRLHAIACANCNLKLNILTPVLCVWRIHRTSTYPIDACHHLLFQVFTKWLWEI